MLRVSSERNNETVELRSISSAAIDSGLFGGAQLSALADAAVLRDVDEMSLARDAAIEALGAPATMRALAVAGNFEMMNRLLDAIGVGPSAQMSAIGDQIGVPLPDRWR
jgi:hypothetical protein